MGEAYSNTNVQPSCSNGDSMKGFIPPGSVDLRDAVERAAWIWYRKDMQYGGLTPEEADLVDNYALAEFSGLGGSSEDQRLLATTDKAKIRSLSVQLERCRLIALEETWDRLIGLLFMGIVSVRFVDEDTGETHDVPPRFWGSKHAPTGYDPSLRRPWTMVFPVFPDDLRKEGAPFIDLDHLDNALTGRSTDQAEPALVAESAAANAVSSQKGRAGRKPEYDWIAFVLEAARIVWVDGAPNSQNDLIGKVLVWYQQEFGKLPSESTAKIYISKLWKQYGVRDEIRDENT
jgi:hypothetical protein